MNYNKRTVPTRQDTPLTLTTTEHERWQAILAASPKAAAACCNHDCEQGDECPVRAAREDLTDDTGHLLGRGILLISCILIIALGVYLFA